MRRTSRATRHSPADDHSGRTRRCYRRAIANRLGDDVGRHDPQPVEVGARPRRSRRANARSPSKRVCAGRRARAKPSCALCASEVAAGLSSAASVTTTTSVVLARSSSNGSGVGNAGRVGRRGRTGDRRVPSAADDVADRVDDRERDRRARRRPSSTATPRPPATAPSRPRHLPDGRARARADAARVAAARRARPRPPRRSRRRRPGGGPLDVDEIEDARGRHDRHRAARGRESVAAFGEVPHHAVGRREPERTPPENTTASTRVTVRAGSSRSISRVAGAPPRTSPEPTVPAGNNNTVTPDPPRDTWPERTPKIGKLVTRSCSHGSIMRSGTHASCARHANPPRPRAPVKRRRRRREPGENQHRHDDVLRHAIDG